MIIYLSARGFREQEMFQSKFTGTFKCHENVQRMTNIKYSIVHFHNDSCACVLAAEQKARSTYDNILRLAKDHDVADPIRFLRAREIVHYQRFGESLRLVTDELNSKNYYAFNPDFDSTLCNK